MQLNNETFKIQLYFDSYKSSTDCQWNEKYTYTLNIIFSLNITNIAIKFFLGFREFF